LRRGQDSHAMLLFLYSYAAGSPQRSVHHLLSEASVTCLTYATSCC
jgi:hypothetical protein